VRDPGKTAGWSGLPSGKVTFLFADPEDRHVCRSSTPTR
jgi:hypothetical protein